MLDAPKSPPTKFGKAPNEKLDAPQRKFGRPTTKSKTNLLTASDGIKNKMLLASSTSLSGLWSVDVEINSACFI